MNFKELMNKAKSHLNSHNISEFLDCGTYSCAIMTDKGNVYCGILDFKKL